MYINQRFYSRSNSTSYRQVSRYMDSSLQRHHNERGDGVSNHQPHDCLLNCLLAQTKKNIKARRHWPLWGHFREFARSYGKTPNLLNRRSGYSILKSLDYYYFVTKLFQLIPLIVVPDSILNGCIKVSLLTHEYRYFNLDTASVRHFWGPLLSLRNHDTKPIWSILIISATLERLSFEARCTRFDK